MNDTKETGNKKFLEIIENVNKYENELKCVPINIDIMRLWQNSKIISEFETAILEPNNWEKFNGTAEEFKSSVYQSKDFTDLTGYECFYNSFYISDFLYDKTLKSRLSKEIQLKLGKIIMENITQKNNFPKKAIFVFSFSENEEKWELKMRFYTYREDEKPWLDIDNLEGYEDPIGYYTVESN